ncbi:TIGR01212 family radical SAM protein [Thalassomonas sp. M1454]|uniref:TIGR01212 family radical SAM protein n=1 Tax=Thalassomonas sp. M1454 TaxID=2594477 RepID=UPI00117E7979|nr:TIGR01212 family radical SAM protein [Thalassomonas sp. M1454]TRX54922.1 TIGR01212 family radical SAM protein [Thalassomonas sp. M1454]
MQLDHYVNTFGKYLKAKFGTRIKKLTIDAAFTCPNRDGTLGKGGCTFCNVDSFSSEQKHDSISQQMTKKKEELGNKAEKYLAYFQAYTSTYQEVEYLKEKYEQALEQSNVIGLCVGTRPDCVPTEVLDLLKGYVEQGYEVWLELGLQTANDETLKRINRGHDFATYVDAVKRARKSGIKICTHLIVGLPNETEQDNLVTLQKVLEHPVDGIKLHPLHVVEGSTMAKAWKANKLDVMSMQEYASIAGNLIRNTPSHIIFHRVSATANKPILLAPDWCQLRWPSITEICRDLHAKGIQGNDL